MKPAAQQEDKHFLITDFRAVARVQVPSSGLFSVFYYFSGKKKSNLGWTPLHLASYFGHKDVVEELLKVGLVCSTMKGLTTGQPS